MEDFQGIRFPLIDAGDLAMVGWQAGMLNDGSGNCAIVATCSECQATHAIVFPPGASLIHIPGQGLSAKDLDWRGPIPEQFAAPHEPSAAERAPSAEERGEVP